MKIFCVIKPILYYHFYYYHHHHHHNDSNKAAQPLAVLFQACLPLVPMNIDNIDTNDLESSLPAVAAR